MTHKFQQILAIDIEHKVPDLQERIGMLSKKPLILAPDIHSLDLEAREILDVEAILVSIHQPLDEAFLSKFQKLSYIGILGTSTKKIALDYCEARKISVLPVHEYCDHETAEWVLLQILQFYRDRDAPQSVFQKTLGIVGAGSVGQKVAIKAMALGLRVNFNANSPRLDLSNMGARYLHKADLFKNSEIISFHTPAHQSFLTRYLLDQTQANALLINTCLGKVSSDQELEIFLKERPDVTIIMDSIAATSYPDLQGRALIERRAAFETQDSKRKLIDIFVKNAATF